MAADFLSEQEQCEDSIAHLDFTLSSHFWYTCQNFSFQKDEQSARKNFWSGNYTTWSPDFIQCIKRDTECSDKEIAMIFLHQMGCHFQSISMVKTQWKHDDQNEFGLERKGYLIQNHGPKIQQLFDALC